MGELITNPKAIVNQISGLTEDIAIVVDGNKSAIGAAEGQYVLLRNSSISGVADGAYKASKAIPADTALDSTYFTSISGGVANDLNSNIANAMKLDFSNVEVYNTGTSMTATKKYFYEVLGLNSTNQHTCTVNSNTVSVQDNSGSLYVTTAAGILYPGDSIYTNARLKLIPFVQ